MNDIKPIILTAGDPAGIAAEITLKAWATREENNLPAFAVHGDTGHLDTLAKSLDLNVPIVALDHIEQTAECFPYALPVIEVASSPAPTPGTPSDEGARIAAESLTNAMELALRGDVCGVVTNPVCKETLHAIGFEHPGQTEFFAAGSNATNYAMMLSCPGLKVVPQTIHLPLKDVSKSLTTEAILSTLRLLAKSLAADFALPEPRIAVAGLNPHAGENGAFGSEDQEIIRPAILQAQAEGLSVTGPLPADTMFHQAARKSYDIALCMYHDQALIPVKTLGFDQGVNTTLGLPIVRTSPDHGTAFDIAGKGIADPNSLIAALKLAGEIASNRSRT